MIKQWKIGLALSGGAARGFAHIGVLKVLDEAGLEISCVAGTSMGALIGALYATGMKVKLMERLMRATGNSNWVDFGLQRMGLIKGDKIEQVIYLLTRRSTFDQLRIPLAVVAVDLYSGKKVVLKEGLVCRAVRASISIPGYFVPVELDDMLLVDGGVLNRIPADVVREMGANFVIAVDTGFYPRNTSFNSVLDVVIRSFDIMLQELSHFQLTEADVVISPELCDIAPSQFERCAETIEAGEKAARAALPEILAQLEQRE
ncbi:MAG: patatin-like phospholipase family protein [Bacillota bacterium]